jgi:phosphohistidine phosphatase SixA
MPRIKLFLMRHSKSCCNHIRHNEADIPLSQEIRDPALSIEGYRVASEYGPRIRSCLQKAGFNVPTALITSSRLRRAKETASLIFGRPSKPLNHFAENGAIPENTPAGATYEKPSWSSYVKQIAALAKDGDSVATVGHGSYLLSLWPMLTGQERNERLNNLDGILLDISVSSSGQAVVHGHRELRCLIKPRDHADKCTAVDNRKIATLSKMTTFRKRGKSTKKRSRSQRGGFTNLPLGYVQPGGQFAGTSAQATGTDTVFPTTGDFVRAPLSQSGGFSPAIMGAFASNGARLMPFAGYMGYRMYTNQPGRRNKTRRHKRR